jgi:hypothetical protein
MVRSRKDINLPKPLTKNSLEEEKKIWKLEWKKIIKEYESFLKYVISLDYQKNTDGNNIPKLKNQTF